MDGWRSASLLRLFLSRTHTPPLCTPQTTPTSARSRPCRRPSSRPPGCEFLEGRERQGKREARGEREGRERGPSLQNPNAQPTTHTFAFSAFSLTHAPLPLSTPSLPSLPTQHRPPRRQGRTFPPGPGGRRGRRPGRRRWRRLPDLGRRRVGLPPGHVRRRPQAHRRLPQPDAGRAVRAGPEVRAGHAHHGVRGLGRPVGRQDGAVAARQAHRARARVGRQHLVERWGQRVAQLRDGRPHLPAQPGAGHRLPQHAGPDLRL